MPWIRRICLRGFRGFDGCAELGPGVNIIVGPNCSGKTALIEAIAYLLALGYSNLRETHGYLALLHAARDSAHHSLASLVSDKGSVEGLVVEDHGESRAELLLEKTASYVSLGPAMKPVVEVKITSTPRRCKVVYTLSGDGGVQMGLNSACLDSPKLNVGVVTPGVYPYDFFDQLVGRAKRDQNTLWKILSTGIPVNGSTYTVDVASDDWGRLTAYVMEEGRSITFYAVGRGLQRALILLATLEYSDIIAIDEIESAMHPELLATLAKSIVEAAAKGKQVLTTTQSLEAARFLAAAAMDAPRDTWRQPTLLLETLGKICREEEAVEGELQSAPRLSLIILRRERHTLKSTTLHGCEALNEILTGEDIRLLYTLMA